MAPKLAAVILTYNEARNVVECIDALIGCVDEVWVWDSLSTDGTQALARTAGAKVQERAWDNYAAQRQAALEGVDADWVLFVDADERVTPALAGEVRTAIADATADGFWIARRNFIVGQEIRAGGYYPDHQLRLLRRVAARYVLEREVHEIVALDGEAGYLENPLIHYNYVSWSQFHRKQREYARYEARILAARGIRPRPHNFVLQPLREFWRRYVSLSGWRDGWRGLQLALLLAWYYGATPYWVLFTEGKE